ncbi:carboxypeptidase B [Teleopsis dalmanni]|uniref:carboxypeptidase B n=1 Tax=Teleopsis dalmanni TaxID=139649 RepID=UPI0018CCD0D2|nr:carboxypeptidase B [Teleopsis dalmanni]
MCNSDITDKTCSITQLKYKNKFKRFLKKQRHIVGLYRPNVLHSYLSHSQILHYLEYTENKFLFTKIHMLGYSYEHRPITAIEINWYDPRNCKMSLNQPKPITTEDSGNMKNRDIIFIEGGTHAREWITISVALNCIYQLTERNTTQRDVLRKLRFFIIPVVNPDGYEYSRTKNVRWRKNRRPQENHRVIGIDCNRNYDVDWENGNAHKSRCTFKGDKPFSEPETRAVRNIMTKLANEIVLVLSLHSYAQSIMYPWGYTKKLPPNNSKLMEVAQAGHIAIRRHNGRRYKIGNISHCIKHTIPGSIIDYAFGLLKIPLAIVVELPSKELGFQPPIDTIYPIGQESWLGIRAMSLCAYKIISADKSIILVDQPYTKNTAHVEYSSCELQKNKSNMNSVGTQCDLTLKPSTVKQKQLHLIESLLN